MLMEDRIMADALKPCPFCGGEPVGDIFDATKALGVYSITHHCKVWGNRMVFESASREKVAAAWNTRADAALMDEVRGVLEECADDLESMVEAHYGRGVKDHPAMKPKYERDMEPARRARALLTKIGGDK
jgi:hypothetical protein